MWYFLILSLSVSSCVGSSPVDSLSSADQPSVEKRSDTEPWKKPYLPNTIEPIKYDLFISPHLPANGTAFYGNVTIYINALIRTKAIIVHKKDITITYRRVLNHNGNQVGIESEFDYPANDYYVIKTTDFLEVGSYRLIYHFRGNMTFVADSAAICSGLYTIPYDNNRQTNWLVQADLNPNKARNVFPNFDEPRFKASFKIMIQHWRHYNSLSNMPVETFVDDATGHYTVFKWSPKMSSYDVVFSISDYSSKNKTDDGKLYRVWTRANQLEKADYVLKVTPPVLKYLGQELNIVYPLQIIDQVAVPGALLECQGENWALTDTILNMWKNGDSGRYEITKLIAHTMAHSYFGNLVTCRFWEHVWLNEGLATFYEVQSVTAVNQSLCHNEMVYGWNIEKAMDKDEMNTGGPLIKPSDSSKAVTPRVDAMVREKGAEILRMVETFMGVANFKRAIKQYLTSNANNTVVTADLWSALQAEAGSGLNISQVMKNWTERSGFPVINVELLSGNRINATQKHFLKTDASSPPTEAYKWYVPLTYKQKGGLKRLVWMNQTNIILTIHQLSSSDWIEFNCERAGYYRVNYHTDLWGRLSRQLIASHTVFSELSRSAKLGDALALARAEQLGYDVFLSLTKYASKESELTPWLNILKGFGDIKTKCNSTMFLPVRNYLFELTKVQMSRLQVNDEGSYIDRQLRPEIMRISCFADHAGCIANTTRIFRAWIQNASNVIPMNFRWEAYCIGIGFSTVQSDWNTTLERFRRASPEAIERLYLLRALTCSDNTNILESLLDHSLDSNVASADEVLSFIENIVNNFKAGTTAWTWLKRKYSAVKTALGNENAAQCVPRATVHFNTQAKYQEVRDFFNLHSSIPERIKTSTLTRIQKNMRWLERNYGTISTWFDRNPLT